MLFCDDALWDLSVVSVWPVWYTSLHVDGWVFRGDTRCIRKMQNLFDGSKDERDILVVFKSVLSALGMASKISYSDKRIIVLPIRRGGSRDWCFVDCSWGVSITSPLFLLCSIFEIVLRYTYLLVLERMEYVAACSWMGNWRWRLEAMFSSIPHPCLINWVFSWGFVHLYYSNLSEIFNLFL
jgi:hypothetical protein